MSNVADVVIIGAGLNGAATAFFLLGQGVRRIVVLERDLPGAGASGDDVGLLRSHYDNRPETELAARSMPYFRDWPERVGGDCGWMRTGFFRFIPRDELDKMRANVAFQREFGETADVLSPAQVSEIAPEFRVDDIGAVVHEPHSGTSDNARATASLLKRACADGAELRVFTRVRGVRVKNGRVAGVETDRGVIATPVVVLAAGTGSRPIAATCGLDLPFVAKAISVAEIAPPGMIRLPGSYMDPLSDSWVTPRQQGRAIISALAPVAGKVIDPEDYDGGFSRDAAAAGLGPVARRLPGLAPAAVTRWWTRPDCFAPDGKPVIGPVDSIGGLYLNTAGAGKGHKTAPAAGLALAELIAGGAARSVDIAPFALARFAHPLRPWSESEYAKRVIG